VVRLALLRTLLGTACGVAGAIAFSRVVTLSLDPQPTFDFWVLPVVPALMAVIAVLASAIPVRRALRISPLEVLRSE
jgi:ABC-type antimicrobial peptide transport system permease subunit